MQRGHALLCCRRAADRARAHAAAPEEDVDYFENRPANTVTPLTAESCGSTVRFEDAVEAALSDQIPLAQAMKKTFNDAQNKIRD